MRINDLHCPVRPVQAFADKVKRSMEEEGMRHPVIVVRMPAEDLIAWQQARGLGGRNVPDVPWVNCVCGGTNRVHAAKELGYTHIDCVLAPDFEIALQMQRRQREDFNATAEAKA